MEIRNIIINRSFILPKQVAALGKRNVTKVIAFLAFCYLISVLSSYKVLLMKTCHVGFGENRIEAMSVTGATKTHRTNPYEERRLDQFIRTHQPVRLKTILLWNSFFSQRDYGLGSFGRGPFVRGRCRVDTCQTTSNRSLLSEADAVIIHGAYGLPANTELPKRVSGDQVFVFFEFEPPALLRFSMRNMNDMFNLTFTYLEHLDTDIHSPYGRIRRRRRRLPREYYQPPNAKLIRNKTKQVVWIVSDCHPVSKRMEYARELAKHINVDIFGKCGRDECPFGAECTARIERDYKFYLAFENSVCDDYITEKTFRMLHMHYLIPVVLGGADYDKYVPARSVIDVRQFSSPRHLADYLHKLDRNHTLFMEYFQWKKHYVVDTAPRIDGFCRLCEILHLDGYPYKSHFNIERYWSRQTAHCVNGEDEEKLIHLKE